MTYHKTPARPLPRGPDVAEIRAMLEARALEVAQVYAPAVPGAWLDKGDWWTLNPGRGDNVKPGNFVVHTSGQRRGTWHDFGANTHGDLIDLIGLALRCDTRAALAEARRYLGITAETVQDKAARQRLLDEAARRTAAEVAQAEENRQRRARGAHAMWLEGRVPQPGGPVWSYLAGRGLDLAALPRLPGCLREAPALNYVHTDPTTGEIFEGRWPAMLALIHAPDNSVAAVHRTWLAEGPKGWGKAQVPAPKKVLGAMAGGSIHLWRGVIDGKPARPLAQAPAGSRVYITEGVEDGLSVVRLAPELRVVVAISLGNMGAVALPPAVAEVVLVADRDDKPAAQEALARAIAQHQAAGRRVRLWQPAEGDGKDINDVLRRQLDDEEGANDAGIHRVFGDCGGGWLADRCSGVSVHPWQRRP